jgi:hypothetical protein
MKFTIEREILKENLFVEQQNITELHDFEEFYEDNNGKV